MINASIPSVLACLLGVCMSWLSPAILNAQISICNYGPGDTTVGFYPSPDSLPSTINFDIYDEWVNFVLPTSIQVFGTTIPIDSARLEQVNRLPSPFQWDCATPNTNCRVDFDGAWRRSCVHISAQLPVTINYIVTYTDTIEFQFTYWVSPFGASGTITQIFKLFLWVEGPHADDFGIGILDPQPESGFRLSIAGNPITSNSTLLVEGNIPPDTQLEVFDKMGKRIWDQPIGPTLEESHILPLSSILPTLSNGVYWIGLRQHNEWLCQPLMISK